MPLLALHRREVRANVKKVMAPKFVIARRPQADVAISQKPVGQQAGLGEFGVWCVRLPRPLRGLAMTNLIASRRRMRAAKIANLQGAHNPQGARRIRKAAKPPTAAQ